VIRKNIEHFKSDDPPFALQEIHWALSNFTINVNRFAIAQIYG